MKNQEDSSTALLDPCVELDALTAAHHNHVLLFENEYVRVIESFIEPGQTVPLHSHPWPSTHYILSSSDFVRRDVDGRVITDSRIDELIPADSVIWCEVLPPHTVENVGKTELRAICVELKQAR